MFKIESKVKNGGIWDGKKLVRFDKGALETNDAALAEKARNTKGFTVTGAADKPPAPAVPEKLAGLDVEQLKGYASANGIDIGNANSVNGIVKKIVEAETAQGQG